MNTETKIFEWKFEDVTQIFSSYRFSIKFGFHGSATHFLSFRCWNNYDLGHYSVFRLSGCLNPLKRCASCFYTMCLIDSEGTEIFATKGKMGKCSNTVLMILTERNLTEIYPKGSVIVRFSWYEKKHLCEKGTQTDQTRSAVSFPYTARNLESKPFSTRHLANEAHSAVSFPYTTRNLESKPFSTRHLENEAVSAESLKSTQTEVSDLSSIKDLDFTDDEYSSLDQYILCSFRPSFLETSYNDHECLYESKFNTNFFLREGTIQFPVHRVTLSHSSAVFFSAYYLEEMDINTVERRNLLSEYKSTISDSFHNMVIGKLCGLTSDTAVHICEIANKFNLTQIRDICEQFLMDNLKMENICEAAAMADKQNLQELRKKIVEFIGERLEELQETTRWKEFVNTNPLLTSKLLSSALIANKMNKK